MASRDMLVCLPVKIDRLRDIFTRSHETLIRADDRVIRFHEALFDLNDKLDSVREEL
jgi:hypothetical protein